MLAHAASLCCWTLAEAWCQRASLEPQGLRDLIRAVGGDFLDFYPQQPYDLTFSTHPPGFQATEGDRDAILFASHGLAREIGEFYRVELKLPEAIGRMRDWSLEVVEPNGKKPSRLRLSYPHSLVLCQ